MTESAFSRDVVLYRFYYRRDSAKQLLSLYALHKPSHIERDTISRHLFRSKVELRDAWCLDILFLQFPDSVEYLLLACTLVQVIRAGALNQQR